MPRKPRPGTTVYLTGSAVRYLTTHGALSDRTHGAMNRSARVSRKLDLFEEVVGCWDPRKTRGFPEEYYLLTLRLLSDPWDLQVRDIHMLPHYLALLPEFERLTREAGVDRAAYLKALEGLNFTERLALADHAELAHAPQAPAGGELLPADNDLSPDE